MPIHFIVVFIIIIAIAAFSQSWAGVMIAVICLVVYYGRQYYRLVVVPKRRLVSQKAESSENKHV